MFHGAKAPELEFEELSTFFKRGDDDPEFRTLYQTFYDGGFSIGPDEVEDWRYIAVDELLKDLEERPERYTDTLREVMREYVKLHKFI